MYISTTDFDGTVLVWSPISGFTLIFDRIFTDDNADKGVEAAGDDGEITPKMYRGLRNAPSTSTAPITDDAHYTRTKTTKP